MQRLDLCGCSRLQSLALSAPRLRHLALSGCSKLSSLDLSCSQLEELLRTAHKDDEYFPYIDRAQVLLELGSLRAFQGVVAGVMYPRRNLVDQQRAVRGSWINPQQTARWRCDPIKV